MLLAVAPAGALAAGEAPSQEEARSRIMALEGQYPTGTPWSNADSYRAKGLWDGYYMTGYGCAAFAYILSDAAFDSLPARKVAPVSFADVRIGDVLRLEGDAHSVVVTGKAADSVTIAEGNMTMWGMWDNQSVIYWGRTLSQEEVEASTYLFTRYPEGAGGDEPAPELLSGQVGAQGDNVTWTLDGDGLLTIRGTGDMQDYPNAVHPWYSFPEKVKKVVIEEGVTSIGNRGFYGCEMTEISLPSTLTSLGEGTFVGCNKLVSVTIPGSVKQVDESAFSYCAGLEQVVLEEGITSLDKFAFSHCTSLTKVSLPSTLTTIGQQAFEYAENLASISIPSSVTTIGTAAFCYLPKLRAVTLPAGLRELGWAAFQGTGLEEITLPEGITRIQKQTFNGCTSLKKVHIPQSVTSIETAAFSDCPLTGVYYAGTQDQWERVSISDDYGYNQTLHDAPKHFGSASATPSPTPTSTPTPTPAPTPDPDTGFTDLTANWYKPAVKYVVAHGLMSGEGGGKFNPNGKTTRGQIVTVLYNLENKPAVSGGKDFTDVTNPGAYYYNPVQWASANGIVSGYEDGRFMPGSSISRQDLAAILYRYAQYKGYDVTASGNLSAFPDGGKVQSYAKAPMQWAVGERLINGSDGQLLPRGTASRAQMAQILMTFCQNVAGLE